MSSTNRGAARSPNDFYATNPVEIRKFLCRWVETDVAARAFWTGDGRSILDPSAGGLTEEVFLPPSEDRIIKHLDNNKSDPTYELSPEFQEWKQDNGLTFKPSAMPYPEAINITFGHRHQILTQDIRENSRAQCRGLDFLNPKGNEAFASDSFDMVITNPPFSLALGFIKQSLRIVKPGGYVVMLLPLPFYESYKRNGWLLEGNMPDTSYCYPNRLSFTPDGKTDSIPYQHAIWQKTGEPCHETKLRVLPY